MRSGGLLLDPQTPELSFRASVSPRNRSLLIVSPSSPASGGLKRVSGVAPCTKLGPSGPTEVPILPSGQSRWISTWPAMRPFLARTAPRRISRAQRASCSARSSLTRCGPSRRHRRKASSRTWMVARAASPVKACMAAVSAHTRSSALVMSKRVRMSPVGLLRKMHPASAASTSLRSGSVLYWTASSPGIVVPSRV